ncbi:MULTISPECIES: anchored repeat-type ABC transporter permease subunit [Corynebacterium]|uniref:Anchored repeat-type ABC transporter permease subunit n=1 Tax=Corynebacterium singulare TaxID=161899 RepID=A0ABS9PRI3_9CORY|nr:MULTISPECIES: anchored repeat-type ABC transporter permease subunit [Corynebacterium]MCG7275316.1 anchored repeat-type ABC transporter permease subunit [Corynebacterium singulare]MCQ9677123.1 anchored repeat-type ABC transporter permease subunit [Corynebacterium sp. BF-R-2]OFT62806.1 ABC transporter ATP-binding protein [Corynebacterium sp. HMSC05E07]
MIDISLIEFFQDLTNPHLDFLARAVAISVLAAIVCGVVGCYVVLRGMAFIGDAVSHAVFPGLAIAFVLQGSVLLGGAVAGCTVALLIACFSQRRTVREDSVIGIFFAASFALGMVIISRVEGYTASLTSFLFGSLTGVSHTDLYTALVVTVLIVGIIVLLGPQLTATCLDKETARAMGLPVFALDIVLYLCVTGAVVISVGTVGNILVLALLITPAATARLLCDSLGTMMAVSAAIGSLGSFFGIYLAWAIDLPAGATIVLLLTACFLLAWIAAPILHSRRSASSTPTTKESLSA